VIFIVWVIKHTFNKFFCIKEPLNNLHAVSLVDGKAHLDSTLIEVVLILSITLSIALATPLSPIVATKNPNTNPAIKLTMVSP
jgi:hypothetical protein